MDKCECTLSQSILGDGCQYCNVEMAQELKAAEEAERSSGRKCRDCGATCQADASLMCLAVAVVSCDGDDLFF